jgi:hypothetical protein
MLNATVAESGGALQSFVAHSGAERVPFGCNHSCGARRQPAC